MVQFSEFSYLKINVLEYDLLNQTASFTLAAKNQNIEFWKWANLDQKNQKLLRHLFKKIKFPCAFNLINATQTNGFWESEFFICLPDYLIDVTSIAECISTDTINPYKYLLHLLHSDPMNLSLLIGSTVNDIFDELIINPETNFDKLIQASFYKNPMSFCLLEEEKIHEFVKLIKSHFHNLQKLNADFLQNWKSSYPHFSLEPSFYSNIFGIQGRLDAFFIDENNRKIIIELKSGKPFKANQYGINANHQAQVSLYNLLIASVFPGSDHLENYILYSILPENNLKKSPLQSEVVERCIYIRNSIIFIQLALLNQQQESNHIFDLLKEEIFSDSEKYTKAKAIQFISFFQVQSEITKIYIKRLIAFVALEQLYTKVGKPGNNGTFGLSSLWMQTVNEKIENFNILFNLIIEDILFEESEFPIIIFRSDIVQIHNFRIGDTLVLYENQDRESAILHQQVYKSTLIGIDENKFYVRLRSRIFSNIKSKQISRWNIEHDLLDKSFLYAYQNIFQFMKLDEAQQGLWLGNIAPKKSKENHRVEYPELDAEFNNILSKIVNSLDYFLLWGPPGTGKTSVIVKYLSHYLVQELGENVLLIAYTNRAVDEMCDAIISHGETWESSYLRIGSRYSVNPRHASNLFESQIRTLKNRKEIQELISSKKIFCATVASILGKKELFNLKQFDTIIIDEASQILEPQLIAWISQFKRIVMIGDHLQLPAVSIQSEQEAIVHEEILSKSGIQNFNQSLFERLYQKYEAYGWDHAFAILNRQGRMDKDIMDFVSATFYKSQLELLPHRSKKQLNAFDSNHTEFLVALSTQRLIFIDCEPSATTSDQKSNEKEAKYITKIITTIKQVYDHNNKSWDPDTLGVITPFRVQISTIQKEIQASALNDLAITVDTVERYQGGARDIIILSTSITLAEQLDQICSLNRDGVDRKLNVAITRSREQFILIGSKTILYNNRIYKSLIDASYQIKEF